MEQETPKQSLGSAVVRVICYLLSAIILVLLILTGVLFVVSFGPDPGDRMALMGVPMLAVPITLCCVILLFLLSIWRQRFKTIERFFFAVLGASFLCVFGLLLLLG